MALAKSEADSDACVATAARRCASLCADHGTVSSSTAVRAGGKYGQMLTLPDLGRLRLADTVYLTREGPKTIGLLCARDRSARTCLLTLDLRPSVGPAVPWRATVERVTREGVQSPDGVGASFLFSPRQRIVE